jgi:hypothetical protein
MVQESAQVSRLVSVPLLTLEWVLALVQVSALVSLLEKVLESVQA